ncbi:MAG: hypothetical protein JWM68_2800, partial [Verrucomicrobiales bacterium]|nr:hypothetical protein [Verrucomicrobiales bacterium]
MRMKRFFLFLSILACHDASALPTYEPFADATATTGATSYAIGSPLANQTNALLQGWGSLGGNFPGSQPIIASDNLSYPGLPTSLGNSVAFVSGTNMGARLDLQTNGNSGTFYYSYLLKITDLTSVPTSVTNNPFAGFSDTAGAQPQQLGRIGTRVLTKRVNAGYVLGLSKSSTAADFVYDTTEHAVNDVLFIVGSYELVSGVTNVNLWINPPTNTFGLLTPPTPTLSASNYSSATGLNGNGVRSFAILCQFTNAPSGIMDELRVEKTWGNVTGGEPPQPLVITAQPTPRTVVAGDNVVFAVGVSGTSPSYRWLLNGAPISSATSATYSLANVQTGDQGTFSVIISNSLNSVTSAAVSLTVSATPFRIYNTNLVVTRIGNGAQVLSLNGNSFALDQFSTNGSYLNTVSIPDSGPSAMVGIGLNSSGSSLTGTCLTRSSDQRLLVLGGYNTTLSYGASLKDSTSATVPRGLAIIDTFSQYTLRVANTDSYTQTYWRGGVTDNGTNFWGAATGTVGTYYFGFDSAAAVVQTNFGNVRSIGIFNGSIYCVSAVSGNNGVLKLDGMPKSSTGANPTNIFPGSTSSSDLEVSPNGNIIYLADDRTAPNGGVQRWDFDGSAWTRSYTLTNELLGGARYVTADFSGAHPVIYAVSTESENSRIVRIDD